MFNCCHFLITQTVTCLYHQYLIKQEFYLIYWNFFECFTVLTRVLYYQVTH